MLAISFALIFGCRSSKVQLDEDTSIEEPEWWESDAEETDESDGSSSSDSEDDEKEDEDVEDTTEDSSPESSCSFANAASFALARMSLGAFLRNSRRSSVKGPKPMEVKKLIA